MGELMDKAKGKAKQIAGVASNDRGLEAEGKMDEVKGAAKGKFEEAKQRVKETTRELRDRGPKAEPKQP